MCQMQGIAKINITSVFNVRRLNLEDVKLFVKIIKLVSGGAVLCSPVSQILMSPRTNILWCPKFIAKFKDCCLQPDVCESIGESASLEEPDTVHWLYYAKYSNIEPLPFSQQTVKRLITAHEILGRWLSLKLLAGKSSGTTSLEIFWKYPCGLEVPGPSAPLIPFLGI